ncbi:MAG: hypothetical protein ACE5NG_03810, partial [bacterium]
LGKIPFVGEIGVSLFTILWVAAALFMLFLAIIAGVALILAPAIIATTNEDAFEAIFQSFSTSWSQPWRFVLYEGIVGVLSVTGFVILAILVKRSFLLMNQLLSFSMGNKFIEVIQQAHNILQGWTTGLNEWIANIFGGLTPYFYFAKDFSALDLPPTLNIAAYVFSFSMMIVGALILSYLLATFNTGSMITYLVLRKLKDDENLLERQDEEFERKETEEGAEVTKSEGEKEVKKETKVKQK